MQDHPNPRISKASSPSIPQPVDPFTRAYVAKCARQLIGSHGFHESDRVDLEQTLFAKLTGKWDQADPDDPQWKAFVAKTVTRHIASLLRDREASKRDHRRTRTIHFFVTADDDGPVELGDVLQEHEVPSRRYQDCLNEREAAELRTDVAKCIDRLRDPRHRELCRHLMQGTVAEAARSMQIPRTTINAWLPKIRSRFEELGLANYLENSSSFR